MIADPDAEDEESAPKDDAEIEIREELHQLRNSRLFHMSESRARLKQGRGRVMSEGFIDGTVHYQGEHSMMDSEEFMDTGHRGRADQGSVWDDHQKHTEL